MTSTYYDSSEFLGMTAAENRNEGDFDERNYYDSREFLDMTASENCNEGDFDELA